MSSKKGSDYCTAIGIDLGTTNSCVGVIRNGRVDIIANEIGNRLTPSMVSFDDEERHVGQAAKEQCAYNPKNTIFEVKRLMGRKFNDPDVQKSLKNWQFAVLNDNNYPKIPIKTNVFDKTLTPEEISAMVLRKLKEEAEAYVGKPVLNAVITVPAYFNISQRQATIDAGKIAGLNVMQIINEPTAAAIAYGIDHNIKEKRNILVYDLGGGTFDVSILTIDAGKFKVRAVNGNTSLGGADFTNRLIDHCVSKFEKNKGINLKPDSKEYTKAIGKLRQVCEKVKINISISLKERAHIEYFYEGEDLNVNISRAKFEQLCLDLFEETIELVKQALADAKMEKNEIQDVVLAGGSTRIPKIQELLQNFFFGHNLKKTINVDEAVAYGAAYHAASLVDDPSVERMELMDVIPLSLGVDTYDGIMGKIIPRNTRIPTKLTKTHTTISDYQKSIRFKVYEGEQNMSVNNEYWGEFTIEDIERAPHGKPSIDVTFEINKNGILNVTAVDRVTASKSRITFTNYQGRLCSSDIDHMIAGCKKLDCKDIDRKESEIALNKLESFCYEMRTNVQRRRTNRTISDKCYDTLHNAYVNALLWVDDNDNAEKEECDKKIQTLKRLFDTIL